jgi:hypothetical protein
MKNNYGHQLSGNQHSTSKEQSNGGKQQGNIAKPE